ncbi:hypothetical protein Tco_0058138 [Tanacetum coccineum]
MYRTVKIIMISNECHVTIVLSCFYITQIVRLEGDRPPSKPSVVPCGRKIYERETSLESLNPFDVFALHKARIEFLYRRRVVEKEVRCRRRVVEEVRWRRKVMDPNFTNENDPWEYSLDIDDSDLNLTPILRSSSSARVEPYPYTPSPVRIIPGSAGTVQLSSSTCYKPSSSTPNPVRIIPGPAGTVQLSSSTYGALMSTQEYMQKVVEDVGEDSDFNSGAWISATNYVLSTGGTVTGCLGDIDNFLEKGKLAQVVAIVKTCSPNALGDLNVTMKDLSGTVRGTVHYKVHDVGTYGKDIHVGAAMILAKVSVFTPRPSEHYINITKKNMVKVFRKDTVSLA